MLFWERVINLAKLIFKLSVTHKYSIELIEEHDLSFMIVDRIQSILEETGLKQKDLANMLGKKESEIRKWMRGTHNFTIETISSIENVLGIPILQVAGV